MRSVGHRQKGGISALGHQPQPAGSGPHSGTFPSRWRKSQAVSTSSLTPPRTGFRLVLNLACAPSTTASSSLACFSAPLWHFWCFHKMPSTALHLLFSPDSLHWWPSFCQALIIIFHNTWYSLALPEITWWWLHRVDRINSLEGGIPSGLQLDPGRAKPTGFLSWPNDRTSWKWLHPKSGDQSTVHSMPSLMVGVILCKSLEGI